MIAGVEIATEERRRLRWQCRRGLLELDLLFRRFVDEKFDLLSAAEQHAFQMLLRQQDHNLLAWLQGQETPPNEFLSVIRKLQ